MVKHCLSITGKYIHFLGQVIVFFLFFLVESVFSILDLVIYKGHFAPRKGQDKKQLRIGCRFLSLTFRELPSEVPVPNCEYIFVAQRDRAVVWDGTLDDKLTFRERRF